jgi:hypothetical protein
MKHKGSVWGLAIIGATVLSAMALKAYDLVIKPWQTANSWVESDTLQVQDASELKELTNYYRPKGIGSEAYSGVRGVRKLNRPIDFRVTDNEGGTYEFRYDPNEILQRHPEFVHQGLESQL